MNKSTASSAIKDIEKDAPFRRFVSEFFENRLASIAFAIFCTILFITLSANWIVPQNPYDLAQISILDGNLTPGEKSMEGFTYWLGTDEQGRDILSAIIYGIRISLFVAVSSAAGALLIGTFIGLVAAFFGGWLDSVLMRIVDIQLSFPSILTALILIAVLGNGIDKVIIALITVQWAYFARTIHGSALVERNKEYIEAARCLCFSNRRILFRHLLPNCLPPLIVVATVQMAFAVALEATLSFLGLGLPITQPSLGLLIANGFEYLLSGKYWISFFPGIALLVVILSINLVGDRLRDVLNPRLER